MTPPTPTNDAPDATETENETDATADAPDANPNDFITPDGISLFDLQFNDIGTTLLRMYLGEGPVYERFKARFDAADLAWFLAGLHKDGRHDVLPNSFHPDWSPTRETMFSDKDARYEARFELRNRLKELVFDALTMLSRGFGCTPLLLNVDGTVKKGEPITLETVKIDVCLPPHLLEERPGLKIVVAEIVQKYAEGFGLPAVQRWYRAFKKAGFSIQPPTDIGASQSPSRRKVVPLIPKPNPQSNHYIFYGRPIGDVDDVIERMLKSAPAGDRDGPARRQGLHRLAAAPSVGPSSGVRADSGQDTVALRKQIAELQRLLEEKDDEIMRLRQQLGDDSEDDAQRRAVAPSALLPATPTPSTPTALHPSARMSSLLRMSAPTSPSPTPTRPNTPSPLPARADSITSPIGAAAAKSVAGSTRSKQRKGKAPETPVRPTAASVSSIGGSFSSVSSVSSQAISDWTASVAASPIPPTVEMPLTMPWPASFSPNRLVPPSALMPSSRPLRRFDIIGPATDTVIRQANLPLKLHGDLFDIAYDVPQSVWAEEIQTTLDIPGDVTEALVSAMLLDIPTRQ